MEVSFKKCRNCHYFDEAWHKGEDGKTEVKLSCGRTGSQIPDYDYTPKNCLGFVWSSDAWREYAD